MCFVLVDSFKILSLDDLSIRQSLAFEKGLKIEDRTKQEKDLFHYLSNDWHIFCDLSLENVDNAWIHFVICCLNEHIHILTEEQSLVQTVDVHL